MDGDIYCGKWENYIYSGISVVGLFGIDKWFIKIGNCKYKVSLVCSYCLGIGVGKG